MTNHKVFVGKGAGGWGEGLELEPTGKRRKVVSITGEAFTRLHVKLQK